MHRRSQGLFPYFLAIALALTGIAARSHAQPASDAWHQASEAELKSNLPARAPVEKEHIETEMRTASGIVNARGQHVAGVVLITAGYAADGKYSHFFATEVPIQLNDAILQPGNYVIGWQRSADGITVHFYDAASGAPKVSIEAKPIPAPGRVESFRIWPPHDRSEIQIGRFAFPYRIPK